MPITPGTFTENVLGDLGASSGDDLSRLGYTFGNGFGSNINFATGGGRATTSEGLPLLPLAIGALALVLLLKR